jgi:hypothetical protein
MSPARGQGATRSRTRTPARRGRSVNTRATRSRRSALNPSNRQCAPLSLALASLGDSSLADLSSLAQRGVAYLLTLLYYGGDGGGVLLHGVTVGVWTQRGGEGRMGRGERESRVDLPRDEKCSIPYCTVPDCLPASARQVRSSPRPLSTVLSARFAKPIRFRAGARRSGTDGGQLNGGLQQRQEHQK